MAMQAALTYSLIRSPIIAPLYGKPAILVVQHGTQDNRIGIRESPHCVHLSPAPKAITVTTTPPAADHHSRKQRNNNGRVIPVTTYPCLLASIQSRRIRRKNVHVHMNSKATTRKLVKLNSADYTHKTAIHRIQHGVISTHPHDCHDQVSPPNQSHQSYPPHTHVPYHDSGTDVPTARHTVTRYRCLWTLTVVHRSGNKWNLFTVAS